MSWRYAVMLGLALAGCTHAPCSVNSECPAGNYCADGRCESQCSETDPCPAGHVCDSFGRCAPVAAGADGGTDAGAATEPACVIAGGVDADGDGYCAVAVADADCDDGDGEIHPAASEVCTTGSSGGGAPVDEDCDGSIDEDCPWHFGIPHWLSHQLVVRQPGAPNYNTGPALSPDGLALYWVAAADWGIDGGGIYVAERSDWSQPFGAPRLVETPVVGRPAFGPGGETYAASSAEVVRVTRVDAGTFSEPVSVLSGLTDVVSIALAPSGLELLISQNGRRLYRSTRSALDAAWTVPVAVATINDQLVDVNEPTLSLDGRVLFVYGREAAGDPFRIFRAERALDDGDAFGPIEVVDELDPDGSPNYFSPFLSLATREIFFAAQGGWSGSSYGLWRAEICRDGPCPAPQVDCPEGMRSPDRLHCYWRPSTELATYADAVSRCADLGAHVVTLHSEAERLLVWNNFGTDLWVGASDEGHEGTWEWITGEPFTYAPWATGQPDNSDGIENCGHLWSTTVPAGLLNDAGCGVSQAFVCERDLWPTW